jgi:hypothetical protein
LTANFVNLFGIQQEGKVNRSELTIDGRRTTSLRAKLQDNFESNLFEE